MVIRQGDIYWAGLGVPSGSAPGYNRPVVIVQNNQVNRSRIDTVIVVPLTTNLRLAQAPGNVLIRRDESNLRQDSVANVSQIVAIDRESLREYVGALSPQRIREILAGVRLFLDPD